MKPPVTSSMKSSNRDRSSVRAPRAVRLASAAVASAVALSVAFACNGQLEVGEDETPEAGGTSGASQASGTGGVGGSGRGGAPVVLPTGGGAAFPPTMSDGGAETFPPEDDQVEVIQDGSSAGCPEEPTPDLGSCDDKGIVCGYRAPSGNSQQCTCSEVSEGGVLQWSCRAPVPGSRACPSQKPENGASCFGSFGSSCNYPQRYSCFCSSDVETWECVDQSVPDYRAHPDTVDPELPIDELTAAQREAWCTWYDQAASGPGYPPRDDSAVNAEGYTDGGCIFSYEFPCRARVPFLSIGQCVQNLTLSACAAPIGELSDCLATVYSECQPSPHGCARYFEKPKCDGTIALRGLTPEEVPSVSKGSFTCPVRVE